MVTQTLFGSPSAFWGTPMRVEVKIALISLAIVGWAASCGGRSGIELGDVEDLLDASLPPNAGGSGGGIVDGSVKKDVGQDTTVGPDVDATPPKDVNVSDQKDFFDTLPWWPDSGPLGECAQCLSGQCGDAVNACYNDASCWGGIQCAIPSCFIGGGGGSAGAGGGGIGQINYACLLDCFDNKMSSIMEALSMFQCITSTCGSVCGLGGLAGAGGGGQAQGFTFYEDPSAAFAPSGARYIGHVRVPEPEEVSFMYPWLADVLEGRTPDPLPPSARKR
jgi:hypothetical protein